jgi:hypothetical protein
MSVDLEGLGGAVHLTRSISNESINTFSTCLRWAPATAMFAGAECLWIEVNGRGESRVR